MIEFLVFTTPTCPNCPVVKEYLQNQDKIKGKMVDASTSEGLELARKYEVTAVPTVIFFQDDKEINRAHSKEETEKIITHLE